MLYTSPFLTVYCCVLAALLGLCMGSFLNCFAYRIVHGESVTKGRSHCDVCGHVLAPRDLVPVVSYLVTKGKCRYCGAKLSVRHLVAEITTGAVYVLILLKYDISLQALQWALYASLLLLCAFADLEGYIIPDGALIVGLLVRAAYLLFTRAPVSAWGDALLGGFAVGGGLLLVVLAYEKIKKVEAMGGGDLKLLFVTGLYLGPVGNRFRPHRHKRRKRDPIPLGPGHLRRGDIDGPVRQRFDPGLSGAVRLTYPLGSPFGGAGTAKP